MFALKDLFEKKMPRLGIYGSVFFSFITVLGTQSRGGLVGILGSGLIFFVRTKHKLMIGVLVLITGIAVITFMPASWKGRMQTIHTYEEDHSASTRILQWKYAVQLASESPIIGNGFYARYYQPFYVKYMTGIDVNRAVHSVFFQILEEQGYGGLFLYLLLMISAMVSANKVAKKAINRPDLKWAATLLFYSQFSIAGFAFNGLTINVGYIDLYYYILAFVVLLISHINMELAKPISEDTNQKSLGI